MVAVNHMNDDVAEVNDSDPPMLPGSFLYEKEPGYEARSGGRRVCRTCSAAPDYAAGEERAKDNQLCI